MEHGCTTNPDDRPVLVSTGGDDYVCKNCFAHFRFCKECVNSIPSQSFGHIKEKFVFDGLRLYLPCQHYKFST